MNKKQPKLKFEEDKERTATRSPPKKEKVEQTQPRKKLKLDADKAAEKAQHLRFGKAEITPDEASRMTKAQKREMYASAIARSAAHREVDQYEDDNVGTQALNEGLKTEESAADFSKSRYSRKLKKKAKLQAKKKLRATKSSAHEPDKVQNAGEANVIHKQYDPENFAAYPARFSGPFLLITQSILRAAFPALSICLAIMFSSSCVIVAQFATR